MNKTVVKAKKKIKNTLAYAKVVSEGFQVIGTTEFSKNDTNISILQPQKALNQGVKASIVIEFPLPFVQSGFPCKSHPQIFKY